MTENFTNLTLTVIRTSLSPMPSRETRTLPVSS